MSILLQSVNSVAFPFLFGISALFMLIFFYKAIQHPHKSYGLLMIVILILSVFMSGFLELITSLTESKSQYQDQLNTIYDTLDKFAVLWVIFLAIFHYIILRSFKGKYKRHPLAVYIICASLLCLFIAILTNSKHFDKKGINYLLKDMLAFLILALISIGTSRFREQIKYGPYSVARESASILIRFSSLQAVFAILYAILDGMEILDDCLDEDSKNAESTSCSVLTFGGLIVYECWVWFAVISNWQLFSLNAENDVRESKEILLSSATNSAHSSDIEDCLCE